MVRDPVCGMEVDENLEDSHKSIYMGKTYYFCSKKCLTTFKNNPEEYGEALVRQVRDIRKIAVVGAGQVGATFCFALMISGLASNIVLIDQNRQAAEGHTMDLNHGLSFAPPARIYAGEYADCAGADIVVVTAGAAQKPNETRLDLVLKNTKIFKEIIPEIAGQNPGLILIVSNPVDILTYVALKVSGYSMNRVIGSGTSLDTARFRSLLSMHCQVDTRNVHAYIVGEHGDSEVPVWSQVNVAGLPVNEYCRVCSKSCSQDEKQEIFNQVKNAAYEIINKKGYTNFAIALALVRIVGSILRNENSVLTVSTLLDNHYGIKDVCLSIPVILNRNGVYKHVPILLDEAETMALQASASTLRGVIDQLDL